MAGKTTPRALAIRAVCEAESRPEFVKHALGRLLCSAGLSREDRALATELAYGSVRHRLTLDAVLGRFSRVPVERIERPVLEAIRQGLYQLVFLDRVPRFAAVNEAVVAVRRVGRGRAATFVNAVLRSAERALVATGQTESGPSPRRAIPRPDGSFSIFRSNVLPARSELAEHVGLAYSHPPWLVARWIERFGVDVTQAICGANNRAPQTSIVVNELKTDSTSLLASLAEARVTACSGGQASLFALENCDQVASLRSFRMGWFWVQGGAAFAAANMLAPGQGESVLEVCAAPGGKTARIASRMRNTGRIVAIDVSLPRLSMLRANCSRLGLAGVQIVCADGTSLPFREGCAFDACLVDAPCSNTGVLARRAEARWRLTPGALSELSQFQCRLLGSAAGHVKRHGTLVYSTCSIEYEENQQVIARFLGGCEGWRLSCESEMLPGQAYSDGGYVAKLVRAN